MVPVSGKLPTGCTSQGGGMHCGTAPAGYTIAKSDVSPTSVTPTAVSSVTSGAVAPCTGPNCNLQYTPLEPIQGFTTGTANVNLASFINGLFTILFSIGALLAVGRLVIGGILYLTSEVVSTMDQAKKLMNSSLYGLMILAGSYLLLHTINPDLLNIDLKVS